MLGGMVSRELRAQNLVRCFAHVRAGLFGCEAEAIRESGRVWARRAERASLGPDGTGAAPETLDKR
jgi:hypothetical protein